MLHIVNKSPLERCTLDTCLASAQPGGALLLIEDAVYAATRGHASSARVAAAGANNIKLYVLGPDAEARGIADAVIDGVTVIGYDGFVDLVTEHKNCQSWL